MAALGEEMREELGRLSHAEALANHVGGKAWEALPEYVREAKRRIASAVACHVLAGIESHVNDLYCQAEQRANARRTLQGESAAYDAGIQYACRTLAGRLGLEMQEKSMGHNDSLYPAGLGTPGLFDGRIQAAQQAREAMINDLGAMLTHELVNMTPARTSEAGEAVRAVLFRIAAHYDIEMPE